MINNINIILSLIALGGFFLISFNAVFNGGIQGRKNQKKPIIGLFLLYGITYVIFLFTQ